MDHKNKRQFLKMKTSLIKKILLILVLVNIGFIQAQYTLIPDPFFEQFLLDNGMDQDGTINGQVLTSGINTITALEINHSGSTFYPINDLTGIQDFETLETIDMAFTDCVNIDFSGLTNLTRINCVLNPNLAFINASQCTNLIHLYAWSNSLTSIDVSQNTQLRFLDINDNQLTNLDVIQNINLIDLDCSSNDLIDINLTNNINLIYLDCTSNQLENLDVRNNNNNNVTGFFSINNPNLTCIFVDNANYSTVNWTIVDATSTFVETEAECNALATSEFSLNNFKIYPNPISKYFIVETNLVISSVEIFSVLGKKVKEFKHQEKYNISTLQKGVYFIKIKTINNIQKSLEIIIK